MHPSNPLSAVLTAQRACVATIVKTSVLTGADYAYWKRQEERWATPTQRTHPMESSRSYRLPTISNSSMAIAGLEKALSALGLLEQAKNVDLRSPYQDFFDPIWNRGWQRTSSTSPNGIPPLTFPKGRSSNQKTGAA